MKLRSKNEIRESRYELPQVDYNLPHVCLQQVDSVKDGILSKELKSVAVLPMASYKGVKSIDLSLDNQFALGRLVGEPNFLKASDISVINSLNSLYNEQTK